MAMTVTSYCSNKMCGIKGTAAADMVKQNTSCNKNWGSEIIITCDAMHKIFFITVGGGERDNPIHLL